MAWKYINFTEVDSNKIEFGDVYEKKYNGHSEKACEMPLMYNYGEDGKDCLYFEGPEMECKFGIKGMVDLEDGIKRKYFVYMKFVDPELQETFDKIEQAVSKQVSYAEVAAKLRVRRGADLLLSPKKMLNYNQDSKDIPPSKYVKLIGKKFSNHTTFTGLDGTVFDWESLEGVYMRIIPLFQVPRVVKSYHDYLSPHVTICWYMRSAIVTSIHKYNGNPQTRTLQSLSEAKRKKYMKDLANFKEEAKKLLEDKFEIFKQEGPTKEVAVSLDDDMFCEDGVDNDCMEC